jgi:hypothetical protein
MPGPPSRVVQVEQRGRDLIFEDATEADHSGAAGLGTRGARERCTTPLDSAASQLSEDPTLAPLVPVLENWAAVPDGVVVTSDALLAAILERHLGLKVVPEGVPVGGPSIRIPPFVDRGPAAVHAALRLFGRGRAVLPDLAQRWADRHWLGGWAELAAALADLDARCRPGPLHHLAVRACRPDLVAPPAPRVALDLWGATDRVATHALTTRRVRLAAPGVLAPVGRGEALLPHPTWPKALGTDLHLVWRKSGVQVEVHRATAEWSVRAGPHVRSERTPLVPGVPVLIGLRGSLELWRNDAVVARVDVRPVTDTTPELDAEHATEPPIGLADRKVIVDILLSVAASTMPVDDGLAVLLARHESPAGAALAARLGLHPVATLGRWLAAPHNEPLRLALAEAIASTPEPASMRARLPRALRCWIPRLGHRPHPRTLRLVVGGSPPMVDEG